MLRAERDTKHDSPMAALHDTGERESGLFRREWYIVRTSLLVHTLQSTTKVQLTAYTVVSQRFLPLYYTTVHTY